MTDIVALVERSLSSEAATQYMDRVETQASSLRETLRAGELDNPDFAVGLEMEVYGTDETGSLVPVPEETFEAGATKELGVHNAEINTDPDPLDEAGLLAQAERIGDQFRRVNRALVDHDARLISDAMWTIPPGDGSESYLTAVEDRSGVVLAKNMRTDPRYAAIDNETIRLSDGSIEFDVPGIDREFPSIVFESLATSIQPHLQIPRAELFPAYYNAAIRTLGPVLALSTNSPFCPADLYNDVEDPIELLEETHHELRIAVFEQSVNASPSPKVRVPEDIETAEETIDRVVADDLYAPFLREWVTDDPRDSFADDIWEFTYKRSTYWRWLRCVIGGDPVGGGDERSLRIEYRPIPTQPTVEDVVSMQWLTVGLIRGLVETDHPIEQLPWEDARRGFYNAARDGLAGELYWVTADGERTSDPDRIFPELFEVARAGLSASGVREQHIDARFEPIERRWETRTTPSVWKREQVRSHIESGVELQTAIRRMQRRYIERSRNSHSFSEWL